MVRLFTCTVHFCLQVPDASPELPDAEAFEKGHDGAVNEDEVVTGIKTLAATLASGFEKILEAQSKQGLHIDGFDFADAPIK